MFLDKAGTNVVTCLIQIAVILLVKSTFNKTILSKGAIS